MPNSTTIEPVRNNGAVTAEDNYTEQVTAEPQCPKSATDNMPEEVVSLVSRGKIPLFIRRACDDDLPDVLELVTEAKLWLPSKGTDQWSRDWADQEGRKRSDRVQDSLKGGSTWVVTATYKDQTYMVATVTIELVANPLVWTRPDDPGDDSAVYLSRLIVARSFAGLKIGAGLLNWACDYARYIHHAKLVRIDVWTRNFTLHRYYRKQRFKDAGKCPDESYPSRALFQRSTRKRTRRTPLIQPVIIDPYRAKR